MTNIDWTKPIEFVVPNGMTCEYLGHNRFGEARVRWNGPNRSWVRVYDDGCAAYQPAKYRVRNKASEYGPEIEPRPLWSTYSSIRAGEKFVGFEDGSCPASYQREMRIDDLYGWGAPMVPGGRCMQDYERHYNRPWRRPIEQPKHREMTLEDLGITWAYYSDFRPWYQTMQRWSEWSGFPVTPSWSAVAKRLPWQFPTAAEVIADHDSKWELDIYGAMASKALHDMSEHYARIDRYKRLLGDDPRKYAPYGTDWVDVLAGQA